MAKGKTPIMTPRKRHDIKMRYLNGDALIEIAAVYKSSPPKIKEILVKEGVRLRPTYERISDNLEAGEFDIDILSQNLTFDMH